MVNWNKLELDNPKKNKRRYVSVPEFFPKFFRDFLKKSGSTYGSLRERWRNDYDYCAMWHDRLTGRKRKYWIYKVPEFSFLIRYLGKSEYRLKKQIDLLYLGCVRSKGASEFTVFSKWVGIRIFGWLYWTNKSGKKNWQVWK